MHCPITGINIPRYLAAALAGFVFIFAFDFLVHGNLLMDLYEQTSELWRAPEDMVMPWMMGTQILIALITAFIYACGCCDKEGKGIKCGIGFGIKIGLLMAVLMAASYAWMPIPLALALGWAGAGLGTGLGLGIIFSLVYKK
ncbi:MAG: hypothetical protein DHS20C02_19440 [Micavibrio sp.]|nr:MAG: hypothetical protein DHS20C02_19440 [Micavibrio sp.]